MTSAAPQDPSAEDLATVVQELYEYLCSIASPKGTLFFKASDIERMFEHGKAALAVLQESHMVVFDVTTQHGQGVWRLTGEIDLRNNHTQIQKAIDLTLQTGSPKPSKYPQPPDPVWHS